MSYNGCTITINPCQSHGWRGWWEYAVTNGQQSVTGRSRGTKREVVSFLKWKIDHNEMFRVERNLTMRAVDLPEAGENLSPCPLCGTPLLIQDLPESASH